MKKYFFALMFATLWCHGLFGQTSRVQSLGVFVTEISSAWCGSNSGTLAATVLGGTPPYSYFWNGMPGTDTLLGVPTGIYDVLVVDAVGDSAQSSAMVDDQQFMPFYVISLALANPGMNNGAFQVAMYPSMNAQFFPQGSYSYILFDSTGFNLLEQHNLSYYGGFTFDAFYTFDSLPAGSYYLQGTTPFGCTAQITFNLKTIPAVIPTLAVSDACNGTPTGSVKINLHPSPSINVSTFNSNFSSTTPQNNANPVTSKYKVLIADSANSTAAWSTTKDSLLTFSNLLPGNYTIKVFTGDTLYGGGIPNIQDSVLVYYGLFTVNNDPNCSVVKGRVFGDYNANCNFGFGDVLFSGTLIELNPGGYTSVTNAAGEFFIPVVSGNYTLKQYAPYQFGQVCPDTNTFTINISTPGTVVDVQVADSVNVNPDIQIGLFAGTARPGFDQAYLVTVRNLTPNNIPAQTVTLNYDSSLTFISTSPVASTSSAGQVTWSGVTFSPFSTRTFNLTVNTPVSTVLGTVLSSTSNVTAATGETNTTNNIDSTINIVTGSFDPNDKAVFPQGFDASGFITNTQELKYTIRFQNTGTDTAFAVMIADTLPLSLNKYSLSVLNASHPFTYEFAVGNVVKFHFENILLPDSNSNEPASHGFVKFKIDQTSGNTAGTVIENNAAIYFDFNSPVITNTVTNTVFDCNQMATTTLSNSTMCENDSIQASSALLFDMNREWFLDGTSYANDSSFYLAGLAPGNYSLTFVASNSVCSQTIANNIVVNPIPSQPFITTIANMLQSSSANGNQWLLSGIPIGGATASSYTPTATGFYSVMVTDTNGCSNLSDSTFVLVTSIDDYGNSFIKIFPNPIKEEFTICGLSTGTYEIIITDVIGQQLLRSTVNGAEIKLSAPFNKGIYFVTIKKGERTDAILKIIKQ